MSTKRFGYLDDLSLKNQKVGIGTSTANEKLEVLGGTRGGGAVVTGIATLTSYEGFQNKKTSYVENVNIAGGESGTLSGEVVIGAGTTINVGTGATTGQGSIKSLKVSNTFNPPIGRTNERPSAPKPGALFYNKDFRTIEYWDGNFWRQVTNTTRRGRGFSMAGGDGTNNTSSIIQYFDFASKGNAQNFGDLIQATNQNSATGNEIRTLCCGGTGNGSDGKNEVQYFASASLGAFAADFGDLTAARRMSASTASSTRALTAGGMVPAVHDTIDYVEIMSIGNSIDFGNLTVARRLSNGALASPTRSVFFGGSLSPGYTNKIDYVTTASKGNAVDFGTTVFTGNYQCGCGNQTRGLIGGGYSSQNMKTVQFLTIASTGNSIEFGNLTTERHGLTGASNSTRGVWSGGGTPSETNVMDFIEIATGGEGEDFGDLSIAMNYAGGTSDSHGGLGGGF